MFLNIHNKEHRTIIESDIISNYDKMKQRPSFYRIVNILEN